MRKTVLSLTLLWCLWDHQAQELGLCFPLRDLCPGNSCYTLLGDLDDPRLDPELDTLLNDHSLSEKIDPE